MHFGQRNPTFYSLNFRKLSAHRSIGVQSPLSVLLRSVSDPLIMTNPKLNKDLSGSGVNVALQEPDCSSCQTRL